MILVIGATGNVGRHVLSQLHATGAADVRALVRPGETAHRPDGVDVATGSLDDPDGLAATLTGVKTVFLVWPFLTTEGAPAVLEAIGQHAQRLVYLSSIGVGGRDRRSAWAAAITARPSVNEWVGSSTTGLSTLHAMPAPLNSSLKRIRARRALL